MKKVAWPNTDLIKQLFISYPLIQAPMAGGATTPELIAAVSNAGGLGSLAAGYLRDHEIKSDIQAIKALTNKPFCVNLLLPQKHEATAEELDQARKAVQACCTELNFTIPAIKGPYAPSFDEQMQIIIEEKVPILSFAFGVLPDKWIAMCKQHKIILIGTATTLDEAIQLQEKKIDAIVAQGSEAGGHRSTFLVKEEEGLIKLSSLVSQLVKQIKLPVIAAGGIMEAKGITNILALGASGVQMGTAFLCCDESGIHPHYKKILLNSKQDSTALTRAFSGRLARGVRNAFMSRMEAHKESILDYPIQNTLTTAMRKEAAKQNNTDFMSMWAGQAAYLCKAMPAAQLIQELNEDLS